MANLTTGMDEPKKPSNSAPAVRPGDQPKPRGGVPIPRSKRGIKGFFGEVGREMRHVAWPTKSETNRLTSVVLGVCGLVVVLLTAMGYVFSTLIQLLTKGNL